MIFLKGTLIEGTDTAVARLVTNDSIMVLHHIVHMVDRNMPKSLFTLLSLIIPKCYSIIRTEIEVTEQQYLL